MVAQWLDRMHVYQETPSRNEPHFYALCMLNYEFRWAGKWAQQYAPSDLGGSICPALGLCSLGTSFHFASYEHFYAIQDYLASIGLVKLSEKHLHRRMPK